VEITIKGKNTDINDDLEQYTERKLGKLIRLSKRLQSATVTFTENVSKKSHQAFRAEILLITPGQDLRSEEDDANFYIAIDAAVEKIRRQLKKLKTKRQDRPREQVSKIEAELNREPVSPEADDIDVDANAPMIYVHEFSAKPITNTEAIMQLEVSGRDMLMFVNDSGVVNCLTRRDDGSYTLHAPERVD
jgi:putative sigma-54 modulation protein